MLFTVEAHSNEHPVYGFLTQTHMKRKRFRPSILFAFKQVLDVHVLSWLKAKYV